MKHIRHLIALWGMIFALGADAAVTVVSKHQPYICRLVVINDTGDRRQRTIHDGPARRGYSKEIRGGNGNQVCYSRSTIPPRCDSGMTPWRCVTDLHSNRHKPLIVK